jgi:precorrin-3B C17-methyltransferase
MNAGRVDIIGLGPGAQGLMTFEADAALRQASDLVGYQTYLAQVPALAGQRRHPSDNRVEIERARHALDLALGGARVAVVSGGDPGVFAMAAAVFEAVEHGDHRWRALDIAVHPGVSAMLAVAARLGAPLGHDFAVISLSDNLKPWSAIAQRLKAAAEADFVMALFNPASKARPHLVHDVFALLRETKAPETIVAFARAISRADEHIEVTTLHEADPSVADMSTLVLVGSSETRRVARNDEACWIYTPRTYGGAR